MTERDALLWQLDMVWGLFATVTDGLTDALALRSPGGDAWTVRQDDSGRWVADWAEAEPDPSPPTTIAWLLWHIGWWWSDVVGRAFGDGAVERGDAPWSGSVETSLAQIDDCRERWRSGVASCSTADLGSVELGDRCWPLRGLPFIRVVAWVNIELMKNTAEIGATRRLLLQL